MFPTGTVFYNSNMFADTCQPKAVNVIKKDVTFLFQISNQCTYQYTDGLVQINEVLWDTFNRFIEVLLRQQTWIGNTFKVPYLQK